MLKANVEDLPSNRATEPPGRGPLKPKIISPQPLKWYDRLVASLIYFLIESVSSTLRMRWDSGHRVAAVPADHAAILCTWHNRLALSLVVYRRYLGRMKQGHRMAAMVSASKDG